MMKLTADQLGAIKRFKPVMDGFTAITTLLDDNATIESLQQAHTETEARLNDKRELEKGIDDRLAACAEKELAADHKLKAADDAVQNIHDGAHQQGDKIKESAQETANNLLDRAKEDARKLREQGKTALQEVEKLVDKKREEFTEIADAVDAKQKELDALNKDLDAAKAHIAVLLTGKV
jgi:vacuolar-type H+-ATPase subunit H